MKEYLRVLPLPLIIIAALTVLDLSVGGPINWISNILHGLMLGAIGCVGQYLIHKNILHDDTDPDDDGCISCGRPE